MSDIEVTLRTGMQAFAAETTAVAFPPPVASISQRAATMPSRRPRWPKVAVVVGCGAILGAGVASAAGVLPAPVESMVREFRSWGFDTDGGASRVASTTDGEYTYEVWLAPLEDGGQCAYDRVVGPDGDIEHGGSSSCSREVAAETSFHLLHYPERIRPGSVASGRLPADAMQVVFEFDDGTTRAITGQQQGWFITTFPDVRPDARIIAIRAVNADGRVIANG